MALAKRPIAIAAMPLELATRPLRGGGPAGEVGEDHRNGVRSVEDLPDWREEAGRLVGAVADELEESVEYVEHVVEESVEFVEHVVEDLVEEGVDLVQDTLGTHRRVWEDDDVDHAQIEVHGIADAEPEAGRLRRALQRGLEQLPEVRWAEVNALTGRVAVAFDGGAGTITTLLNAVDAVEAAHGITGRARDQVDRGAWDLEDRAEHPGDPEPAHRAIAALSGSTLSVGWAVAGRVARVARVPIELVGLVSVVDHNPWLRSYAERVLGKRATDVLLPLGSALANGVAQGPVGGIVDALYHGTILTEVRARQRVWCEREPEFYAVHCDEPIEPPDIGPRPGPFPKGPVERASEQIAAASFAGFGATLAATRDPRRAADALLTGIPKAARFGRDGFAAQLGRTLAARGVVALDGAALRRLDRVNTVVVDSDVLVTGHAEVGPVAVFADHETAEIRSVAERLLDAEQPTAARRADGWLLRPFADVPAEALPRGAHARAAEMRRAGGRPLVVSSDEEVAGIVGAIAELAPGADEVVAAIRQAGHRFLVAGQKGQVAKRLEAEATIPRGERMGPALRELQGDGAVVAAIARGSKNGLAAADVGIGLTHANGRPPWGADLVCGRDLAEAAFLIEATSIAAEVSRRSAQFAYAGSTLGAIVGLTGPRNAAGARSLTMINGAAAASLLSGSWEAVKLSHLPRPIYPDLTPWHALPVEEVFQRLDTTQQGLSSRAALQRRRVSRGDDRPSVFEPFLAELANPLNPILGVGAGLSAAVGSMLDAALVTGLIGLNASVGGIQRMRTDKAVAQLFERAAEKVVVIRDGREGAVAEQDLVRGDVIPLRPGDVLPADCRVLVADGLEIDESALTGESLPVAKTPEACAGAELPDRVSMIYEDSTVAAGEGLAVVVATGEHTEIARSLVAAGPPPPSGVEQRLDRLTKQLLPGALATSAAVAGVGALRRWPIRDIAGTGVSLAVASVPEGLPFVASAAQLAGARRLAQRGAVARNPRTIEALGRAEVLCFDKTGTLTEGRMRLVAVSDGETVSRLDALDDRGRDILAAALRASDVPGAVETLNQADEALHAGAATADVTADNGRGDWQPLEAVPFEASRSVHVAVGTAGSGRLLVAKGAPETLLAACTHHRIGNRRQEMDPAVRARLSEHAATLAARGWRILAVAQRPLAAAEAIDEALDEDLLEGVELIGFVALADPIRRTAAEAVWGVREAGVRPVMVTGDHPHTAEAIAAELGLTNGHPVVTGPELDDLDDAVLDARLDHIGVFARVTPAQKVRIVQAYQRRGKAVAMTGDGANDAAAIRLADVGVALGERATPAARDAADLIITDHRIETLIDAITEGRALWGSVRSALGVLVGGNLGEIGFTGFASLFSRRAPLSPRQFLLVNLFTDLAPAVAIAIRPPADRSAAGLRREGPERSLGEALSRDMMIRGAATAVGASAAWTSARLTGGPARAGTVGLVALVGTQLGQTMLAGGLRQPVVLATGLGSAGLLVGAVQTPGISHFLGCRPLGPLDWAQAASAATAATVGGHLASRFAERFWPADAPDRARPAVMASPDETF